MTAFFSAYFSGHVSGMIFYLGWQGLDPSSPVINPVN